MLGGWRYGGDYTFGGTAIRALFVMMLTLWLSRVPVGFCGHRHGDIDAAAQALT